MLLLMFSPKPKKKKTYSFRGYYILNATPLHITGFMHLPYGLLNISMFKDNFVVTLASLKLLGLIFITKI